MKKNMSYIDSVHRDGTIWNIGVMILLMLFPLTVAFIFGTSPDCFAQVLWACCRSTLISRLLPM